MNAISRESNEITYVRSDQIINCFISLWLTKNPFSLYKEWLCYHLVDCACIIRICKYIYIYNIYKYIYYYELLTTHHFYVWVLSGNPVILRNIHSVYCKTLFTTLSTVILCTR